MSDKGRLALGRVRRALFLLTLLDLWVLGRHRLIDVAPWKPLARAEPGAGELWHESRAGRGSRTGGSEICR